MQVLARASKQGRQTPPSSVLFPEKHYDTGRLPTRPRDILEIFLGATDAKIYFPKLF